MDIDFFQRRNYRRILYTHPSYLERRLVVDSLVDKIVDRSTLLIIQTDLEFYFQRMNYNLQIS